MSVNIFLINIDRRWEVFCVRRYPLKVLQRHGVEFTLRNEMFVCLFSRRLNSRRRLDKTIVIGRRDSPP